MAGPNPVKTFKCASCGAPLSLNALDQALSVACVSCGAVLDTSNEHYEILCKYKKMPKFDPYLEIGSMGLLFGAKWMVVGFMCRSDETNVYCWDEYLLYNPQKGFRWLVEYQGHWSFVVTIKGKPDVSAPNKARYHNRTYNLFLRGKARVHYVVGEFYWKVQKNEVAEVRDYICPPEMLSYEKSEGDVVWSLGQYVEREKIKEAFLPKRFLGIPVGVAPHQPSPHEKSATTSFQYLWRFVAFLFFFNILICAWSPNKVVYRSSNIDPSKPLTTEPFELSDTLDNLEFELAAPVANGWLALEIDLVNEKTGQTFELENGVEYYSGSDFDGSWSEGSQKNAEVLSSVPGGRYHLVLRPTFGRDTFLPTGFNTFAYSLTVRRGVPIWSNFWWITGILGLFFAFAFIAQRQFEVSRWSTSDFSPYDTE